MTTFRVRLNCVDHYQALPLEFDPPIQTSNGHLPQASRPRVPVIRAFGATETGQKVCAHIHGIFPYIYVPYEGPVNTDTGLQPYASVAKLWLTTYSRSLHSSASSFHRSCPGGQLPAEHLRWQQLLCCTYHPRKRRALLRLSCRLRSVLENLCAQSALYESARRSVKTGRHHEKGDATI